MRKSLVAVVFTAMSLLIAGCGGSSGHSSSSVPIPGAAPSHSPSSSAGTLTINIDTGRGLTQYSARARHDASRAYRSSASGRHALSTAIQSVVATGIVYPGYAGYQPVTATATQNTASIPSSTSLSFSNVPTGNNEWIIVDMVGYDGPNGTGSHLDLGQLMGLVSVSSSAATATIDANSSARFQVALTAMSEGILSSYDLQNETTLDADIGTLTASTVPSTFGLYTNQQLAALMSSMYQSYNRTLTVSSSPGQPSVATVMYNQADVGEKNFIYNVDQTNAANQNAQLGSTLPGSGSVSYYIIGNPFAGIMQSRLHTPTTAQTQATVQIVADAVDAASGSATMQHVYGGPLIVGMQAVATPAPFVGGTVTMNGRPPNDNSTVTVPVATSQLTMTMVDPQAAAFGTAPYYAEQPSSGKSVILTCDYAGLQQCSFPTSVVTGVSGSNVSVTFSTFNAFAIAASNMQVCTGLDCFALVNGATNTVRAPFYDAGSKLSYYAWTPAGGAASGVSSVTGGYQIAYAGGTSGAIQSTTPTYFYPGQDVAISSNAPAGTVWTITATCSGQSSSNTGVQQQTGYADVYMTSLGNAAQCSTTNVSFSLPAGTAAPGSITVNSLGIVPRPAF